MRVLSAFRRRWREDKVQLSFDVLIIGLIALAVVCFTISIVLRIMR